MANDVLELRLPPKPEYISVLRAIIGVVAGALSFNYDQIIQLRVAVSEAFEIAIRSISCMKQAQEVDEIAVRFLIGPDRLEIVIPAPDEHAIPPDTQEEMESQALLRSLIDELEIGTAADGGSLIRLVKYRLAGEQ